MHSKPKNVNEGGDRRAPLLKRFKKERKKRGLPHGLAAQRGKTLRASSRSGVEIGL